MEHNRAYCTPEGIARLYSSPSTRAATMEPMERTDEVIKPSQRTIAFQWVNKFLAQKSILGPITPRGMLGLIKNKMTNGSYSYDKILRNYTSCYLLLFAILKIVDCAPVIGK